MSPLRIAFFAAGTLTLAALPVSAQEPVKEPIKLGALLSMSGTFASPSKDMHEGMLLALERRGNRLGGRPVTLILRDDQAKPELAVEAANRLIRNDQVDFIAGAGLSNIMMAVYRPITTAQTFLIGTNSGPAPVAGKDCSPYFFSSSWQNDQNAEVMGEYLSKQGISDVFILAPNYQAGKDLLAGFKRTFKGKIVGEVYTPLSQTDFSAEISRVKAANPKAVYVFYPGGWGVQWAKQYSQAGVDKTIPLYSSFMLDEVSIQAMGDAAIGMFSTAHWVGDIKNAANEKFVKDFRAKFGRSPSAYASQAYDGIQLIAAAADELKGDLKDKEKVKAALQNAKFESVRGSFKFNTNHFPIQDFYLTKVDKQGNELTLVTVSKAAEQAKDVYAAECPMK
jgi:branched-chain amino acid transport system substrate-binding protein